MNRIAACLLSLLLVWSAVLNAEQAANDTIGLNEARPGTLAYRIDRALGLKVEDPVASGRELDRIELELAGMDPSTVVGETARRLLWRARRQILVDTADATALRAALDAELEDQPAEPGDAVLADRLLMRAQLAELDMARQQAAELARQALDLISVNCPQAAALRIAALEQSGPEQVEAGSGSEPGGLRGHPRCDYRAGSLALRILERQALARGVPAQARADARARLDLAEAAGDGVRAAQAWSMLAQIGARSGEPGSDVEAYSRRARELAQGEPMPELGVRLLMNEASIAAASGDADLALSRTRSALALARSARMRRIQPQLLNNIADAHLRRNQPRQALAVIAQGLVLAREFGDHTAQRALTGNAGLARIALGQVQRGKELLAQAEAGFSGAGAEGERATMLREFGEALAAAGEAEAALQIYHRERELSAAISRENLQAALAEIQASFDAELRQRDLAMLQHQLDTRTAEVASQDLGLRIGLLMLTLLVLLVVAGAAIYRRLRGREQILDARRRRLHQESEVDALTGLGNRRAFAARMQELARRDEDPGAVMLLDVDHFKRINDRHGHAVGDAVLVEIARRLTSAVRRDDVLVRWGGEEFLIYAPAVNIDQTLQLVRRAIERIGATAITTVSGELQVSASIGVCLCRLNPTQAPLDWEAALRLADLALYAAKSRGRDRGVAVVGCADVEVASMHATEIDFESAERSGVIEVRSVVGQRRD